MEEWQDLALNNRRIPHGRLGKRGKGGRAAEFHPKNAIGTYSIEMGSNSRGKGKKRAGENGLSQGVLEVHGLNDTEDGFDCSLTIEGRLEGLMLLSGSRKTLQRIVAERAKDRQAEESPTDNSAASHDENTEQTGPGFHQQSATQGDDLNAEQEENADDSGQQESSSDADSQGSLEQRQVRRVAAFEKNSFRTPKFWGRWRGRVSLDHEQPVIEEESAYLIFSKNDCRAFSGTINSGILGWSNLAIAGRKIKSQTSNGMAEWKAFEPESYERDTVV